MDFINRQKELQLLSQTCSKAGTVVLYGRRRVGKTALVKNLSSGQSLAYTQAIEASPEQQRAQILNDLEAFLPKGVSVDSWGSLLSLFAVIKEPVTLIIDELPYLVRSDPSLPSQLQKWLDHDKPEGMSVVLLGSSQSMMHDLFLQPAAPLYGRAHRVLHIGPMNYTHFCEALALKGDLRNSMVLFSMIGGIPWNWARSKGLAQDPLGWADELYFDELALLRDEPDALLKDEGLLGQQAKSILEAIGRGAHRPGEIASRLGIQQTSLSRPLKLLTDCSLVKRVIPFGDSTKNPKKCLYRICDESLRFWFQVYSPHRSRWAGYPEKKQTQHLEDHASWTLEELYRLRFPDSGSYWEKNLEFDCVRPGKKKDSVVVTEVKWRILKSNEKSRLEAEVRDAYGRSKLAGAFKLEAVEVLDFEGVVEGLI